MTLVRFISTRSPYERAGLKFDRSCKRTPAGFPFVEVDLVGLERMGEGGWREMVRDPAISIEVRNGDGVFEPFGQPHTLPESDDGEGRDQALLSGGANSQASGGSNPAGVGGDAMSASSGGTPAGAVGDEPPAPGGRGAQRRGMTSSNSRKGRSK